MLVELRAENYAVIDHAIAVFGPGLNLLTGETGAGKSILVDALALLMGGKASADVVRHGADRAVVSCVFEATAAADAILDENGIDSTGSEIILRREILVNGKGRVFVNNQPATVAVLKLLAPELALVHAQWRRCRASTRPSSGSCSTVLRISRRMPLPKLTPTGVRPHAEAGGMEQGEQDRLRMVDLWSYQRKEIESGALAAGEDAELNNEKRVLVNCGEAVRGGDRGLWSTCTTARTRRNQRCGRRRRISRSWRGMTPSSARRCSRLPPLARLSMTFPGMLRDYAESLNASPDRLAEIEDRLAVLDRLEAEVRCECRRSDRFWRRCGAEAGGDRGPGRDSEAHRRYGAFWCDRDFALRAVARYVQSPISALSANAQALFLGFRGG